MEVHQYVMCKLWDILHVLVVKMHPELYHKLFIWLSGTQ
jgi:hypothetical protein